MITWGGRESAVGYVGRGGGRVLGVRGGRAAAPGAGQLQEGRRLAQKGPDHSDGTEPAAGSVDRTTSAPDGRW